ncbi:MAG: hypothetical protein ACT4QF_22135 [Sporichthyaceae bacterium]
MPTLEELAARVEALEAAQLVYDTTVEHVAVSLSRVEIAVRHHSTRFDRIDARFEVVDARFAGIESRLDLHSEMLSALTVGFGELAESNLRTERAVSQHTATLDLLREWLGRQP